MPELNIYNPTRRSKNTAKSCYVAGILVSLNKSGSILVSYTRGNKRKPGRLRLNKKSENGYDFFMEILKHSKTIK